MRFEIMPLNNGHKHEVKLFKAIYYSNQVSWVLLGKYLGYR